MINKVLVIVYRLGLNPDTLKYRWMKAKQKVLGHTICKVMDHDWFNSSLWHEKSRTCSTCYFKEIHRDSKSQDSYKNLN